MNELVKSLLQSHHGQHEDAWLLPLCKALAKSPKVAELLATCPKESLIPRRELVFRALVVHAPENYNVVVIGQNPFPRAGSATGIAMLDGNVSSWMERLPATLVQLLKAAHSATKPQTCGGLSLEHVRNDAKLDGLVDPLEWFESCLLQGCLWLNCALAIQKPAPDSLAQQVNNWKPIMKSILRTIMTRKQQRMHSKKTAEGCVFVLWGSWAKSLRSLLLDACKGLVVPFRICEASNPAAAGDCFSMAQPLRDINEKLLELGIPTVNWWPNHTWRRDYDNATKQSGEVESVRWKESNSLDLTHKQDDNPIEIQQQLNVTDNQQHPSSRVAKVCHSIVSNVDNPERAQTSPTYRSLDSHLNTEKQRRCKKRLGQYGVGALDPYNSEPVKHIRLSHFMAETMYIHNNSTLQQVFESTLQLEPIRCLSIDSCIHGDYPLPKLEVALRKAGSMFQEFEADVVKFARNVQDESWATSLSIDQIAAIRMYTLLHSPVYRTINAALRDPNRQQLAPYVLYLQLLLSGLGMLRTKLRKVAKNPGDAIQYQHLWRGIALPISKLDSFQSSNGGTIDIPKGLRVVWWALTSCTTRKQVAIDFLLSNERAENKLKCSSVASNSNLGEEALSHVAGSESLGISRLNPGEEASSHVTGSESFGISRLNPGEEASSHVAGSGSLGISRLNPGEEASSHVTGSESLNVPHQDPSNLPNQRSQIQMNDNSTSIVSNNTNTRTSREDQGMVLFHVSSLRGVPIRSFSAYPEQDEVLLPAGTQLVVSRVTVEGSITIVHVSERWDLNPLVN